MTLPEPSMTLPPPDSPLGLLMASLLMAALVGDLVLLPALLCFRREKKTTAGRGSASETSQSNSRRRPVVPADRVA